MTLEEVNQEWWEEKCKLQSTENWQEYQAQVEALKSLSEKYEAMGFYKTFTGMWRKS